jgi:rhomboid family GlyGly-CTERM serine protease
VSAFVLGDLMKHQVLLFIFALWLLLIATQYLGVNYFAFNRQSIADGEYWRLLTAHFIHLNYRHLLLNMLGVGLVLMLFEQLLSIGQWIIVMVISALTISVMMYLCLPQVTGYVGLSGVIHTLYVVGVMQLLMQPKERFFAVGLACLVTLKLLTENMGQGISVTADVIGGHVLFQAHLYGAWVGLFWGSVLSLFPQTRPNNSDIKQQ